MHFSILELFTIGIGPSSSHTVGPMRAALAFVQLLLERDLQLQIGSLKCELFGSLASTGKGHGTDRAVILGLLGETPETVDPENAQELIRGVEAKGKIDLAGETEIGFTPSRHLDFNHTKPLPEHPNGMRFSAFDNAGNRILTETYFSLGGGFIATADEVASPPEAGRITPRFPFDSASELLALCESENLTISEIALANESSWRPESESRAALDQIWVAMQDCVSAGLEHDGILPGGLKVARRARSIHQTLKDRGESSLADPLAILDWVSLYALAVNEENAAGGRVVTAPTNGAAGIIPAVLHHATRFRNCPHPDGVHRFLLTAGAIGTLYKKNASISGADVGCQGEVGVACSMAAAGLVEFLGGTFRQVENAAEIAMEHNLGLTCDPVGGLVQIPCIERNAMGAVKAIAAARMAMNGDGTHFVSLDKVIKTMLDTGHDMRAKYKETSRGGLAVNVVEC